MTTVPKPTDLTATFAAAYDAWNRLVLVYLDNDSSGVYDAGDTLIGKYEYDGLGRRVKKWIDTDAPSSPDGVDTYRHFYYNAGWQILETRKSTTEGTQPQTLKPEYQYVWSLRYIDAAVLRDENKDNDDDCLEWNDGDERLYHLTDANMNVTCLTDANGDAVERYIYDPYGKVTIFDGSWGLRQSSSYDNCIRYCGYRHDGETGLYQVRHRMYHIYLAWLQRDPLGYVDSMNLFEYVASLPTCYLDPSGLGWWDTVKDVAVNVAKRVKNGAIAAASGAATGAGAGGLVGLGVGACAAGVGAVPGAAAGATAGAIGGGIGGFISGVLSDPDASAEEVVIKGAVTGAVAGVTGGLAGPGTAALVTTTGQVVVVTTTSVVAPAAATAVGTATAVVLSKQNDGGNTKTEKKCPGEGRKRTAKEIISAEKKGAINREFPSEMRNKTMEEIDRLAKSGNAAAKKARKLLTDKRFNK